MFGKEKVKSTASSGVMSTISHGTTLTGDIQSDNDLRIDGYISGNIHCKAKVVLGESAVIDGDVDAANADIFGMVNGNVTTSELLCLKSKCVINGNISVGRLDIEANATFNGKCTMTTVSQTQHIPQQKNHYEQPVVKDTPLELPKEEPKRPVMVIGEEEPVPPTLL